MIGRAVLRGLGSKNLLQVLMIPTILVKSCAASRNRGAPHDA